MPKVRIGVVGSGTATIFEEVLQSSKQLIDVAFAPSKGKTHVEITSHARCMYLLTNKMMKIPRKKDGEVVWNIRTIITPKKLQ